MKPSNSMALSLVTVVLHPSRTLDPAVTVDRLPLKLADGYATSVFRYRSAGAGEGTEGSRPPLPVLYLHGIQSHPGWFSASACFLARAGHVVYQLTRRGSGCNDQARGDAASAEQLLDDVATACRFVLEDSRNRRLGLVGVSWGGKLLTAFLASRGAPEAAAMVLVAPGLVPLVDVTWRQKIAIAWAVSTNPAQIFDIPLSDAELFTDNPAMLKYLRADPMRLHQATARFLWASRRLDRMIKQARGGCIGIPTTMILSGSDQIIDNSPTRAALDRLVSGRMRVVQMPGRHTLEFELQPDTFFEAMRAGLAVELQ